MDNFKNQNTDKDYTLVLFYGGSSPDHIHSDSFDELCAWVNAREFSYCAIWRNSDNVKLAHAWKETNLEILIDPDRTIARDDENEVTLTKSHVNGLYHLTTDDNRVNRVSDNLHHMIIEFRQAQFYGKLQITIIQNDLQFPINLDDTQSESQAIAIIHSLRPDHALVFRNGRLCYIYHTSTGLHTSTAFRKAFG